MMWQWRACLAAAPAAPLIHQPCDGSVVRAHAHTPTQHMQATAAAASRGFGLASCAGEMAAPTVALAPLEGWLAELLLRDMHRRSGYLSVKLPADESVAEWLDANEIE